MLVIRAEALGPSHNGLPPIKVAANDDGQPHTTPAPWLRGDLQHPAAEYDGVVARHDPRLLVAKDLIEIRVAKRHEGAGGIAGSAREGRVVLRHKPGRQIRVGGGDRRDVGYPQLVDQAILKGAIESFTPAPGLRRVGRNMLDPQLRHRSPQLRQAPLIHRSFGRRRVKRPVRAIGVEGHREAVLPKHPRQRRHHGVAALAPIERGMQHLVRRIVRNRDERLAFLRPQRQPWMRAAIEMQQLAEARPRLPSSPMPAPRAMLLDQAGRLQRVLHEAVRDRHRVLPPRNLKKVPHVKPRIPLSIEPEHQLDLRRGHPSLRWTEQPPVEQPALPMRLKPLTPPSKRPRRPSQNLGRAEPVQLAAQGSQHHLLHRHGPLPGGIRIRHRASSACRTSTANKADRSLALGSGQIMYSLQGGRVLLTSEPAAGRLCS